MSNIASTSTFTKLLDISKDNNITFVSIGEINGKAVQIKVKKYLTLPEFGSFVNGLSDSDFVEAEDGDELNFIPYNSKILFAISVIRYYTNLEEEIGKLENESIETFYSFIHESGLYDKVLEFVGYSNQFDDLLLAIDDAQKYRKEQELRDIVPISDMAINEFVDFINHLRYSIDGIVDFIKNIDPAKAIDEIKKFSPDQLNLFAKVLDVSTPFTSIPTSDEDKDALKTKTVTMLDKIYPSVENNKNNVVSFNKKDWRVMLCGNLII